MTAQVWYVKRARWQVCEDADQPGRFRPRRCLHRPHCAMGETSYGRWYTGWTRVLTGGEEQAGKEAAAWESSGWTCQTMPASPPVLAEVRAWEQARQQGKQ